MLADSLLSTLPAVSHGTVCSYLFQSDLITHMIHFYKKKNLGYQKLRFKVNTSIRLGQTVVLGDTDDQGTTEKG